MHHFTLVQNNKNKSYWSNCIFSLFEARIADINKQNIFKIFIYSYLLIIFALENRIFMQCYNVSEYPKRKISSRNVIIIHTRVIQTNKHTFSPLNPDNEGIEGGENRERKAKTKSSSGSFCREASLAGPDGPDREMGQ